MTQRVAEEHVEHRAGLLGLRRRHFRLLGQEPLDPTGRHLSQRVVLERRPYMEPQTCPVVLLGVTGQVPRFEVGQPQIGQIRERARRPWLRRSYRVCTLTPSCPANCDRVTKALSPVSECAVVVIQTRCARPAAPGRERPRRTEDDSQSTDFVLTKC
jgi:hypothetical protein